MIGFRKVGWKAFRISCGAPFRSHVLVIDTLQISVIHSFTVFSAIVRKLDRQTNGSSDLENFMALIARQRGSTDNTARISDVKNLSLRQTMSSMSTSPNVLGLPVMTAPNNRTYERSFAQQRRVRIVRPDSLKLRAHPLPAE